MAKRSSTRRPSRQDLGSAALQSTRKALIEAQARRKAAGKLTAKERKAFAREIDKRRNADLRERLQQLRTLGFYTPRLRAGEDRLTLTKSRKAAINRAYRQAEALATGAVFAPYPTRSKKIRKQIAAQARREGGRATRKGVYLPRSERELVQPKGTMIRDKDTGLYYIEVKKQFTTRDGTRHTITEHRYLAGIEALEAQEAALARKASKLALGRNERIRFTIGGPQGNVSKRSFKSFDQMKQYALRYRRDPRSQATFLASLTIYIAAKETPQARSYRKPVAWLDKRGGRRDAHADMLYEGGLFPRPTDTTKKRKTARRKNKG